MIFSPGIILQQQRRGVIVRDEHVHRTVVVEITDGQSPRRKSLGENRAALRAYVLKDRSLLPKQQQWLLVGNLVRIFLDKIIRKAIGKNQVQVAVVVVIKKFQAPAA